ncbi:hypothetical protein Bache_1447 [Bacteroides helcogenes P 36-108]|uniref:DUF4847 domain-containing protein n=2 Tax=Bacteroides helcogenes TaxID=290053 RepID=E6SV70_BACT6|nr:hypothetical protein Bache_1447 [Bacteroides helcogenes P 36-108]
MVKNIGCLFLILSLLPCLGGCNNEDDVMEILNGKTWKLSRLTSEDSKAQFYSGLWQNETEQKNSIEALYTEGYFIVNFNCAEVNGEVTGTVEARGIRASINNATLTVNGKSRILNISGKISGSESDPLARVFLNGLLNVTKYEGDSKSLTLYFKDGNTTKVMGFSAQ